MFFATSRRLFNRSLRKGPLRWVTCQSRGGMRLTWRRPLAGHDCKGICLWFQFIICFALLALSIYFVRFFNLHQTCTCSCQFTPLTEGRSAWDLTQRQAKKKLSFFFSSLPRAPLQLWRSWGREEKYDISTSWGATQHKNNTKTQTQHKKPTTPTKRLPKKASTRVKHETCENVTLKLSFFFWLGAAWVKSRADRPSVSGVNRQLHVQIGCKLGIRNRKDELTKQAKWNKLRIKPGGN